MAHKMVLEEIAQHRHLRGGRGGNRRLVIDASLAGTTGRFFDRTRGPCQRRCLTIQTRGSRLWQLSLELTGAPDVP